MFAWGRLVQRFTGASLLLGSFHLLDVLANDGFTRWDLLALFRWLRLHFDLVENDDIFLRVEGPDLVALVLFCTTHVLRLALVSGASFDGWLSLVRFVKWELVVVLDEVSVELKSIRNQWQLSVWIKGTPFGLVLIVARVDMHLLLHLRIMLLEAVLWMAR